MDEFEYTSTVVGSDDGQVDEARYLNRITQWDHSHVSYQADPKQAQRVLRDMGMTDCTSVGTPGVKDEIPEVGGAAMEG